MVIPIIYGLAMAFYTKPVAFSSMYFGWFFNPHLLYIDDTNEIVSFLLVDIHQVRLLEFTFIAQSNFTTTYILVYFIHGYCLERNLKRFA